MLSSIPGDRFVQPLTRQFIIDVHELLFWGYEGALTRIESDNEDEPSITGYIVEEIRKRLNEPRCPRWCYFYSVFENRYVAETDRSGEERFKPDITVETGNKRRWPKRPAFTFEAKRLLSPPSRSFHRKSGYTGTEGMGCFITGKYAAGFRQAGMLGYVQSESVNEWRERVRAKIDELANDLELIPPQRDVRVHASFPGEWITDHARSSIGAVITLYHVLLDFRQRVR